MLCPVSAAPASRASRPSWSTRDTWSLECDCYGTWAHDQVTAGNSGAYRRFGAALRARGSALLRAQISQFGVDTIRGMVFVVRPGLGALARFDTDVNLDFIFGCA